MISAPMMSLMNGNSVVRCSVIGQYGFMNNRMTYERTFKLISI